MNYEELLKYLDMEDPSEFAYFDSMADLLECEEAIEQEAVNRLFSEACAGNVSELINNYFEDITNGLPEDSDEVFSLLEQVRLCLTGLIENAEDESDIRRFTDEFCRFRDWYSFDSEVEIVSEDTGAIAFQCLRDAIATARAEKFGGESFRYNFAKASEYEIDSYTMSFAELIAAEDDTEE